MKGGTGPRARTRRPSPCPSDFTSSVALASSRPVSSVSWANVCTGRQTDGHTYHQDTHHTLSQRHSTSSQMCTHTEKQRHQEHGSKPRDLELSEPRIGSLLLSGWKEWERRSQPQCLAGLGSHKRRGGSKAVCLPLGPCSVLGEGFWILRGAGVQGQCALCVCTGEKSWLLSVHQPRPLRFQGGCLLGAWRNSVLYGVCILVELGAGGRQCQQESSHKETEGGAPWADSGF